MLEMSAPFLAPQTMKWVGCLSQSADQLHEPTAKEPATTYQLSYTALYSTVDKCISI